MLKGMGTVLHDVLDLVTSFADPAVPLQSGRKMVSTAL